MEEEFKIFVRRLQEGQKEKISETLSPAFMDIHEKDLAFERPVLIQGEAEWAEGTLVLRLKVQTEATLPCAICNQSVLVKIMIPDFCHVAEAEEIKGDVFNFKEVLREAILLALPSRAECHEGRCPERDVMLKYLYRS